ncbi:YaaC family protein [Bacillus solimangrovi]|uniref:YaaC-like Protein n=1 Tax=Bacillus solimangrovi TaxID=1305675 RepID=A0A1E5LCW3_9BACI|nr:YaaC family protein [Bacillus solimangrovi]OEH91927.1 hypothetical protein BFG57_17605 [Bacillus solimangrovi]
MSAELWNWIHYYYSTEHVQSHLHKCYEIQGFSDASVKSYENCYTFIYYLEHGYNYYKTADHAPFSIQPILIFYGYIQLIKACLLLVDPNYPESTAVLAHGVTTRKRKKKNYQFLDDEIKVQKNGLFTHFSNTMFHVKHLEGEKLSMRLLLQMVPELSNLFNQSTPKTHSQPVDFNNNSLTIPLNVMDSLNMTVEHFVRFINEYFKIEKFNVENDMLKLDVSETITPITCTPLQYHFSERRYYIPNKRPLFNTLHECMVHYLILYNLSMICRYETEWWQDLQHHFSNKDFSFILAFLKLTKQKIPYLVSMFLNSFER